jgi:hypothetical protein
MFFAMLIFLSEIRIGEPNKIIEEMFMNFDSQ